MSKLSQYDKFPAIRMQTTNSSVWQGWNSILDKIRSQILGGARRLVIECYPGVFEDEVSAVFNEALTPAQLVRVREGYKRPQEIEAMTSRVLTDDPIFGRMNGFLIRDFADAARIDGLRQQLRSSPDKVTLAIGTGAILLEPNPDILIYADMPRWEIQQRQRRNEISNLAAENAEESPARRYKRGYFLDWRVADRVKTGLLGKIDYLLDTTDRNAPKMITGHTLCSALRTAATRPFRVVPFFDPGPWGGQWMKEVCGLDSESPNYAWCFDCVPEENSLRFEFGDAFIEIPAINLVFQHPRELLGNAVHERFGKEFPIRFDFLDTMEGGNLSLQVHPLTEYIQDKFGMHYTQDESYYLMDAAPDACVYLGLKSNISRQEMAAELRQAEQGKIQFAAEKYVNRWPAERHDHFLIPAGTIHCSGRNSMVLEISATPYIFTFKLWDWGRPGLDGKPRPIHLEHGLASIQWDRDTEWVRENLINRVHPIAEGPGWKEEKTGLHASEFIETRRHWFDGPVVHENRDSVHVLNLVEGEAAVVDSPDHSFEEFIVHFAETFIVPAAVGKYRVRPMLCGPNAKCATIRAAVRTNLDL